MNIVVGMDLSEHGETALSTAIRVARRSRWLVIHIAHAITRDELAPTGAKMARQDAAFDRVPREIWRGVDRVLKHDRVAVDEVDIWQHVRLGTPVDVIRQVAVDYDAELVVVGTRGHSGVKKLILGSVAETLVHDGRFPVLVAHTNRLHELEKTTIPDAADPADVSHERPEGAHVYRSSLISAWESLGRPTSADFR